MASDPRHHLCLPRGEGGAVVSRSGPRGARRLPRSNQACGPANREPRVALGRSTCVVSLSRLIASGKSHNAVPLSGQKMIQSWHSWFMSSTVISTWSCQGAQ